MKAKQEEEMIERHVIEIRKEMNEKRSHDEEHRKQYVHSFATSIEMHVRLVITGSGNLTMPN